MNKQDFITSLRANLSGLPSQELEERLNFYSEMIDDRIEEGLSEEDAVAEIGSVDSVSSQIIAETPLVKIAKEKIKSKKRLKAWEIVLLAVGSPIWLSLFIAAFAVIISLYAVLWSLIISVWAVFGALVGCTFGGIVSGIIFTINANSFTGIAIIGVALVCAGLSIFLFFGCKEATRGTLLLTKKIALTIKKCFVKKEEA